MLVGTVYSPDTFLHVFSPLPLHRDGVSSPQAETGNEKRSFLLHVVRSATVERKIHQPLHDLASTNPHNLLPTSSGCHLCCDVSLKHSPGFWVTLSCSRLSLGASELQVSPVATPAPSPTLPQLLCDPWAGMGGPCYHDPWTLPCSRGHQHWSLLLIPSFFLSFSIPTYIISFKPLNNPPSSFDRVRICQYSAQIIIRDELYVSNFIQEVHFF